MIKVVMGGGTCSSQGGRMKYRGVTACEIERKRPPEIIFKLMSKLQNIRMQRQFESTNREWIFCEDGNELWSFIW
jgi:hypothetical protein